MDDDSSRPRHDNLDDAAVGRQRESPLIWKATAILLFFIGGLFLAGAPMQFVVFKGQITAWVFVYCALDIALGAGLISGARWLWRG